MSKSFFVDTTLCTACRACQVACKQWHDLPAEKTTNRGGFENPKDLSFITYKVVRMREEVIANKLEWLFFPEQCRHCIEAPCLEIADNSDAIYRDPDTGAIIYTEQTRQLDAQTIIDSCPYNIPRVGADGVLAKCDMCNDRVHNGLLPACVATCPTGAMNFGDREEMVEMAEARLEKVKKRYPDAALLDMDQVSVIYLTVHEPSLYSINAVASGERAGISRKVALRRMFKPLTSLFRV